jgi:cytochrome c1
VVDVLGVATMVAGLRRVTSRPSGTGILVAAMCVAISGLAACGDDGDEPPEGLSAEARRGAATANDNACSACHREGGVATPFEGIYGSTVELEDGSTVVADEQYLSRAITDPGAEVVAGFAATMPENDLSDDEVAAVVAYLRELGGDPSTTDGGQ